MTAHNCEFVNVLQFLCSHYLERDFTWFPHILEIPGVFLNFSGSGKSKKLTLVLENREKDVEFCLSIKQWEPCLSKMMWLWNLSIVLLIVLLTD